MADIQRGVGEVTGNVDHDEIDSGNPVKFGGKASTSKPTAVADQDRVDAFFDEFGRQHVRSTPAPVSATGALTAAGQTTELTLDGFGAVAISLAGTWIATVEFEGSIDGGTIWQSVPVLQVFGGPKLTSAGFNGQFQFAGGGFTHFRCRVQPFTSGTVDVDIVAGQSQVETIAGTLNGAPFAIANGIPNSGTQRVAIAAVAHDDVDSGGPAKIGGTATATLPAGVDEGDRVQASFDLQGRLRGIVEGNVAHDVADTNNPVGIGFNAAEFNADPPIVSTDFDRVRALATPQGMLWVMEGHPNLIHREYVATTGQTNDPIIDSVAAGSQIIIHSISALLDNDTTVASVKVRIGFGTATVPAEPADGASVDGMVISGPGFAAGSGVVKKETFVGDDGAELRITNEAPTGGRLTVMVSYFISTL